MSLAIHNKSMSCVKAFFLQDKIFEGIDQHRSNVAFVGKRTIAVKQHG